MVGQGFSGPTHIRRIPCNRENNRENAKNGPDLTDTGFQECNPDWHIRAWKSRIPYATEKGISRRNREAIREFQEGTGNSYNGAEVPVASVVIPMRLAYQTFHTAVNLAGA
jgi:hypothetical protein